MRTNLCLGLTAALLCATTTDASANRELSLQWLRNQAGRFDGPAAGDLAGRSLAAAGDVNGDGHDDFLVGAYNTGFLDPAGRVYLVYGTAYGLPQQAVLGDVTFTGNQSGDSTGISVAGAGDVNGDGFDDVLIGASRWDKGVAFDSGRAYLVYGSASLPATIALGSLASGQGVRLEAAVSGDLAGESVAGVGDVNGDGRPDLLIGAPGSASQAGAAYVVFGGTALPDVIDLSNLGAGQGLLIAGAVAGDFTGRKVAAGGDVNSDGFADALVTASEADPPGKVNGGRVSVIYGGASLPASVSLAALGSAGVQILGESSGDLIGKGLAGGGDVNGDGFDDVLIGSPDYDGSNTNEGRAWLVYGGAALAATIDLASLGSGGVVFSGIDAQDNAGNAVALGGDTNGDGYADLLIAAHNADPAGSSSGEVYLVRGGPALPSQLDLGALGSYGEQFDGAVAGVRVGDVAAFLGDVDDDGFDDLGLASRFADDGGVDAGAAWVIKGGCHWLVAEGSLGEGDTFMLRALGTPNTQWLNFLSPFVNAVPFQTSKGPFWLGNPFLELGVLSFDSQGEALVPITIPTGLNLVGLSAYWQFIEQPQGLNCDLSRLLITTVE